MRRTGWIRWSVAGPAAGATALLCAAEVAWAASGDAGRYGDVGQALTALVIFAIVLVVLGKFAWKPVISQLQRREQEIGEGMRDLERRQQEAKDLEAHYRARIDRAETEARQILARQLGEAEKAREAMLAAAREEGNRGIEAAKGEIEQFRKATARELQRDMAGLAVDIAKQVIREELSPAKHEELVAKSLERIRTRAARDEQ